MLVDRPRTRLRAIISLGRRHGLAEDDLFAGTGFRLADLSDPAVTFSTEVEYAVLRNLLRHTDPGSPLPIELGMDFHLGNVDAWGAAMRTSATLGEALAFSLDFAAGFDAQIQVSAAVDAGLLTLTVTDDHLPPDLRVFIVIRNLVFMAMTARELLGRPLPVVRISARAEPPPYRARVEEFCGVAIAWEEPRTRVVSDAAWLAHPLSGADESARARAVQHCRLELQRYLARTGLAAQVRDQIGRLDGGEVRAAQVAALLGLSERTLSRRLHDEGTSFRELLGQERLRRATDLFAVGHSVEHVAVTLGYSEASAFSNAFKRWAGVSPDAWRRTVGVSGGTR